MAAGAGDRRGERGLVRGCCLLVIVLVVLVGVTVFFGGRALAAPDLGAAPSGTAHGSSEGIIAAAMAGSAATQLVAGQHAILVLSERDLTVLAVAHNPNPGRYHNIQARIRDGLVLVSADTSIGPFGTTALAHVQLTFDSNGGQTQVTAHASTYSVGQLDLPSWLSDRVVPNGSSTINFTRLFAANPALQLISSAMECVAVQSDGVHVAFHRPGLAPDASRCAAGVSAGVNA